VLGVWLGCASSTAAQPSSAAGASAQLPSDSAPSAVPAGGAELAAIAADLGSTEAGIRERAFARLSHLPAGALEAIGERIAQLERPILDSESAYEAVRKFRHSMGSRRADDDVDIAPGVLPWLAEHRDRITLAMAERLALLRSLEAIGTLESGALLCDLLGLDMVPWQWERRRVLHRAGVRLLPVLILARTHSRPDVRRWARQGIAELELEDPGRAVQALADDPASLEQLLRAYPRVLLFDAMPVLVSYVDHDAGAIRQAAREGMQIFAQNGIWMLRRAHRNLLGADADPAWGWRRTMDELYAALDERRLAPQTAQLERGLEAAAAGELEPMAALFDEVLRHAPTHPRREEMAPGYAALAERLSSEGRFARSSALYRRALWLAPEAAEAELWGARADASAPSAAPSGRRPPREALEAQPSGAREAAGLSSAGAEDPRPAGFLEGLPWILALAGLVLLAIGRQPSRARMERSGARMFTGIYGSRLGRWARERGQRLRLEASNALRALGRRSGSRPVATHLSSPGALAAATLMVSSSPGLLPALDASEGAPFLAPSSGREEAGPEDPVFAALFEGGAGGAEDTWRELAADPFEDPADEGLGVFADRPFEDPFGGA